MYNKSGSDEVPHFIKGALVGLPVPKAVSPKVTTFVAVCCHGRLLWLSFASDATHCPPTQVTFVPGLEGLKNKIEAKQKDRNSKQAETVWEAYLRRKKEKAKMRKVRTCWHVAVCSGKKEEGGVRPGQVAQGGDMLG